jgi:hypothetical protein
LLTAKLIIKTGVLNEQENTLVDEQALEDDA